jgi:type I restriction enzyme S subunit
MVYSDVKVINQRNVIDKDFIGGDNFISFEKYEELNIYYLS